MLVSIENTHSSFELLICGFSLNKTQAGKYQAISQQKMFSVIHGSSDE